MKKLRIASILLLVMSLLLAVSCNNDTPEPDNNPSVTITAESGSNTLFLDETLQLTATVSHSEDQTVLWTSSDETIATVDGNGAVTTVSEGDVTITATSETNSVSGEITLSVKPYKIAVDSSTLTGNVLYLGDQDSNGTEAESLTFTILPKDGNTEAPSEIKWTFEGHEVDEQKNINFTTSDNTATISRRQTNKYTKIEHYVAPGTSGTITVELTAGEEVITKSFDVIVSGYILEGDSTKANIMFTDSDPLVLKFRKIGNPIEMTVGNIEPSINEDIYTYEIQYLDGPERIDVTGYGIKNILIYFLDDSGYVKIAQEDIKKYYYPDRNVKTDGEYGVVWTPDSIGRLIKDENLSNDTNPYDELSMSRYLPDGSLNDYTATVAFAFYGQTGNGERGYDLYRLQNEFYRADISIEGTECFFSNGGTSVSASDNNAEFYSKYLAIDNKNAQFLNFEASLLKDTVYMFFGANGNSSDDRIMHDAVYYIKFTPKTSTEQPVEPTV